MNYCNTTELKNRKTTIYLALQKVKKFHVLRLQAQKLALMQALFPDFGIVKKGMWQGEEVLGMELTWNKRYITLAPVATVLGLGI